MDVWFKEVVNRIRTEEDPIELNQYRRLFRENVPLTLRSYFAAYLLKEMEKGSPVRLYRQTGPFCTQ